MATLIQVSMSDNPHLTIWNCWFCDHNFVGFSGILHHWEQARCIKYGRIKELVFETPEYAWCANRITDMFPFFCHNCRAQFQQISQVYYHAERNTACQHLLHPDHCLGALQKFILDYYNAEGTDTVEDMM
ncbi:uncharacterized protein N7511_007909 [Penicillium nucicola]|uniref:uncharacterized protein n=1 Tax=Penicillium nucicola TaxID=1850975 RepID=UPI002544F915|nr:uncharacterized protein N7511_007909 [Penicillium nucicola]KAJ5753756.1 hypothetical protein N7511_007909 [Penicillium nucicola]